MSTSSKTNRIDLRVNQEQKELLEIAKLDIAEHQKLVLSDRDRDLFLSLIANPPQPNQKLVEAMREFQQ